MLSRFARLLLIAGIMGAAGCSSSSDGGDNNPTDPNPADHLVSGAAAAETGGSDFQYVAAYRETGEWIAIGTDAGESDVTKTVLGRPGHEDLYVEVGIAGFPVKAYTSDGWIILFETWRQGLVDMVLISPTGETTIARDVLVNTAGLSSNQFQLQSALDLREALEAAALVTSVAACAGSVILSAPTVVGAVAIGLACTSAGLNIWQAVSDDPLIESSAPALGVAAGAIGCGATDPFGCASLLAETASAVASAFDTAESEAEEEIAQGTGALRFGGAWQYAALPDSWFVVELDRAIDALRGGGPCFDIREGKLTTVDGDDFTYYVAETGLSVIASYERVGDILTVTRLNDDAVFILELDPLPPAFTPDCANLSVRSPGQSATVIGGKRLF